MPSIDTRKTPLLWLNRIFWAVWVLFALNILISFASLYDTSALKDLLRDADPSCLQAVPQFPAFSAAGKAVFFFYLSLSYLVYGFLLTLAHQTIRRTLRGEILLHSSLKTFGLMGMIIIAWPFIDLALSNLLPYLLLLLGDVKVVVPTYGFDITTCGFGLLILTMKQVLAYAIELKQDHDLTI